MPAAYRTYNIRYLLQRDGLIVGHGASDVEFDKPAYPPATADQYEALAEIVRRDLDVAGEHLGMHVTVTSATPKH